MERNQEENKKKNNVLKYLIIIIAIAILGVGGYFGYKALTGKDNEPGKKETVKPNITPLLYEVTKEGSNNKMYLFGSIHVANNSDLVFPEYVINAYNNSHYFACEFDSVAYNSNQEKLVESALKMLYQDGTTIKDHLTEKTYNKLVEFLTQKKSYVNLYEQYKLYFFVSLLSNLMAQDAKLSAESGIDNYFETKAYEDKKTVLEVESFDFQLNLFEEFPDELYELMINEAIDNYDKSVTELQGLYNAWKQGNALDLIKYSDDDIKVLDSYTKKQKEYIEDYNKKLIDNRNNGMLKTAMEYFNNNQDVFFMVGALHIVGDTGLAKQLEKNGYIVRQVN